LEKINCFFSKLFCYPFISLQRQIETTDKQIDNLVYQLYGLTEEEIKIVEGE
jgi:hypothetical protein